MSQDNLHLLSQEKIIEAIRRNDDKILEQIYLDGFPKVRKFVLSNQGTEDEAKDVYQEAFLAAWQNVKNDTFIPANKSAIQGYLYRIATNKWLDWLRSPKYKKTQKEDNSFYSNQTADEGEDESLEDKYLQLEQGFKTLGEDCKELLKSFYYLKMGMKELAIKFGWTSQTVKNNKYRCMEKLRKMILHK